MDDLVKRLREVKDWWREPGRTAEQAANRIETLEAALRKVGRNSYVDWSNSIYVKGKEEDLHIKDFIRAALGEKKDG